jgi:hypothetical protein
MPIRSMRPRSARSAAKASITWRLCPAGRRRRRSGLLPRPAEGTQDGLRGPVSGRGESISSVSIIRQCECWAACGAAAKGTQHSYTGGSFVGCFLLGANEHDYFYERSPCGSANVLLMLLPRIQLLDLAVQFPRPEAVAGGVGVRAVEGVGCGSHSLAERNEADRFALSL